MIYIYISCHCDLTYNLLGLLTQSHLHQMNWHAWRETSGICELQPRHHQLFKFTWHIRVCVGCLAQLVRGVGGGGGRWAPSLHPSIHQSLDLYVINSFPSAPNQSIPHSIHPSQRRAHNVMWLTFSGCFQHCVSKWQSYQSYDGATKCEVYIKFANLYNVTQWVSQHNCKHTIINILFSQAGFPTGHKNDCPVVYGVSIQLASCYPCVMYDIIVPIVVIMCMTMWFDRWLQFTTHSSKYQYTVSKFACAWPTHVIMH